VQEQLQVALAARAAERLLLGDEELSTLLVEHVNIARRIVQKLVLSAAMTSDRKGADGNGSASAAAARAIGPQAIAAPLLEMELSEGLSQYVSAYTAPEAAAAADFEMERLLREVRAPVAPEGTAIRADRSHDQGCVVAVVVCGAAGRGRSRPARLARCCSWPRSRLLVIT
jgi:hypothetical protein